jgi:hypothetical protein
MGESLHPLGLRKSFLFQKHCVSVDITLHNRSEVPVSLRYAQELNFLPLRAWWNWSSAVKRKGKG